MNDHMTPFVGGSGTVEGAIEWSMNADAIA